jgi:isoprenylcysteine carboxyl methyltransferase (ICMT) family protein YpbQ
MTTQFIMFGLMLYLGGIGATLILVRGTIFESLRAKIHKRYVEHPQRWISVVREIIHCPQCCGFWVGWFLSSIFMVLQPLDSFPLLIFAIFLFSCGVSFLALATDVILSSIAR